MINYCSTCQNYVENDPCDVCEGTENNHVYYVPDFCKRNTNADRIRAMTDEEMAEFIARQRFSTIKPLVDMFGIDVAFTRQFIEGRKIALDWLKQEVDDG